MFLTKYSIDQFLNKFQDRLKKHYRTLAAITLLVIIFWVSIAQNYLLFHTLVELFSIIVAFAVFTVTWNSRKMLDSNYLYFQGITYLFIGILDLLHTITFKGMNIIVNDIYYSNQFWVATRFIEATALVFGFTFIQQRRRLNADLTFIGYIIVTTLIIFSILVWEIFPICFIDEVGQTPFKIYAEYTIIAVLFAGLFLLIKNQNRFERSIFQSLVLSISFAILSEFCFTLYVSNYSASNAVGHCAKLLAFFFTYKAVVEKGFINPTTLIFKNLSDSEQNYRTLSENLPVLIFRFDDKGKCIYANKAVQILTGLTPDLNSCRDIHNLGLPEKFAQCIENLLSKARANKEEQQSDYSFDANKHYALKVIPEYTSGIRGFSYLIISYDITQLKVNEKALQDLNATKDKFFSIIAHDLKSPFTSILAYSDLIARNTEKFSPTKLEQMAHTIRKAAQNAYALLDNLLSWSRLQTGALLPKPERINVRQLITEHIELFSSISIIKGVTIEMDEETGGHVISDKQMLNTVLRNLTSNAVKFSHPNSKVVITAVPKEKDILFSVKDDGTGIAPELIDRLFKMESSFTTTGTENEKGSGLGLILCKDFVEKSNGKIWVESAFNGGTTFFFSIPAA
jgi:PAS domain S-box-containing protein